jgi:3-dehydroquinate synthase
VSQDEREQGVRAILNFGHTFGHAIEAATGYTTYLHGEAVALGMLIATDLSQRLGLVDAEVVARVRSLLAKAGLPTDTPALGAARILQLMQMDKKVLQGAVRLVLLEQLGRAAIVGNYDPQALAGVLKEYFG